MFGGRLSGGAAQYGDDVAVLGRRLGADDYVVSVGDVRTGHGLAHDDQGINPLHRQKGGQVSRGPGGRRSGGRRREWRV
ncbi:hypothetical protein GCM10010232_65150 [Streptomyces amakusaensis]